MYNDRHRKRFTSVVAATYGKKIDFSNGEHQVTFTPIHNHKDFEILFIKSGKAYFNIDGEEFEACGGDIVLVNPYEIHSSYALKTASHFSYFCITFDLSLLLTTPGHPANNICKKLSDGYMKFHNLVKKQEISIILTRLEEIFTNKEEGWEFFISSEMFKIFGLLYADCEYNLMSVPTRNHIFTKKVMQFIEQNFTESITCASAAEEMNYDKSYFCRLFKKNFGQSFGEYLNYYRINLAKELLLSGNTVSEAAFSSGFNNLSYFTRAFKKYNNALPSDLKFTSARQKSEN